MIKDFYKSIDEASEASLISIQNLLDSDMLLIGLGKHRARHPITDLKNVISDFDRSDYLMTSQEMWDDPSQEEDGDQFFAGILDEAISNNGYPNFPKEEAKIRSKLLRVDYDALDNYIKQVIEEAYEKNEIRETLFTLFKNPSIDGVNRHLNTNYPNVIYTSITRYIRAGFYGGTALWPLCEHLYNSLMNGGVPTGWVGPTYKNGGDPTECLQVINFCAQPKDK